MPNILPVAELLFYFRLQPNIPENTQAISKVCQSLGDLEVLCCICYSSITVQFGIGGVIGTGVSGSFLAMVTHQGPYIVT